MEKEREREHARARHMSSPCRVIFSYVLNLEPSTVYSPDIGTRHARSIEAREREVLRIRAWRGVSRSNSRSGFSVPCIAILIAHASGSLPIASFHSYSCCPRELVGVKINLEYGDLVQQERRRDSEVCKEKLALGRASSE